jgi:nitrogen fixation-related uncharacterized protein
VHLYGSAGSRQEGSGLKVVHLLIWGSMLVFGSSAVCALVWAIGAGEFRDFKAGAESIFDAAEPVGCPTDSFPRGQS